MLTPVCPPAVLSLQELCCRAIVARTTVYNIDQLPLPAALRGYLKSYAECGYKTLRPQRTGSQRHKHRRKISRPTARTVSEIRTAGIRKVVIHCLPRNW